ncbi:hypothetical protein AVEN_95450-1 [Araneus ventricosus]|uniref:Uncharacterized protein n=1 Tax=Araneus ventricosus TaxID=182803 RepID=A0A4Y2VBM3_ARAVE|nr:hypothetical protein AVEN_30627-1 [Araneus ventricosus]GBO21102.1 hypothetical protein AVEN_95450-1 [Araneus ventricosus]
MTNDFGQAERTFDHQESTTVPAASPLAIPDHPESCYPLNVSDDPEPKDGALIDPSTVPDDKKVIRTKYGRVVKPVNRLKI